MSRSRMLQRGLTLVELMIALMLGLLVTLVATFVVISQGRSREQNEAISEAQETARLAVDLLAGELAQAGFFADFGNLRWRAEQVRYRGTASATTAPAVVSDCVPGGTANAGSFPNPAMVGLPFRTLWTTRVAAASPLACIASANSGSDLLQVKRLIAEETAAGAERSDQFYAFTSFSQMLIYPGGDPAPAAAVANGRRFPYAHTVYFVADSPLNGSNEPSLFRRSLRASGASGSMVAGDEGPLLSGVERVRYLIGVDNTADGLPDRYLSSAQMTPLMWDDVTDRVVSVRIIVIARSLRVDPDFDEAVSFDLGDGTSFEPGADGRRRILVSSTVAIRSQI